MTRAFLAALLAAGVAGLWGTPRALANGTTQAQAPAALHVVPFPGTPDASPDSRIIFSSLKPSDIGSVTVTGSTSGYHQGRLTLLPDGAGTAFLPASPFTQGEQVNVTATLTSSQAGTKSGDPGATTLNFSFTVAIRRGRGGPPGPQPGHGPTRSYLSAPNLKPPLITVGSDPDSSTGDILLSPYHSLQAGPMIVNSRGVLVWFDPLPGWTNNLEVQHYRGNPVLTYWHESPTGAVEEVVLDRHYRPVSVLHGGYGYRADDHEFQLTPQGTALIDEVVPVRADLSSVGGSPAGIVADCVVQELDVRTGQVLWEWHMLGHVPLADSYEPLPKPSQGWGYCHLNSIQQLPNHNLLISARHTWGVYLVDKRSGRIIWTLGGKNSSFKLGPGASFAWQHDARLHGSVLTVFDDGWNGSRKEPDQGRSSAKAIYLNRSAMTATLRHSYVHSPPLVSASQGNAQLLRNGNMFVGWGSQPYFSEYSPTGQQIFSGSFTLGVTSYRAYRFPWRGQPLTRPSLAVRAGANGAMTVYASWNGAGQVTAWRIAGGANPHATGVLVGTTPHVGFETVRTLHSEPPYFHVQALGSPGHVLGTSRAVADPSHMAVFGSMAFVRSSTGSGAIAVGCFTGHTCHPTLRITSGSTVLAQHASHSLPSGRGTLIAFALSPPAINRLNAAPGHQLPVQVTVRDSSGASATVDMNLISYSAGSASMHRKVSQHNSLQIVQNTGFVSPAGTGYLLAACYASVPCYVNTSVRANGTRIAHQTNQYLGADELGFIPFNLDAAGRSMLQKAPGNQLPVQITLSSGHTKATGQIPLVGYP
jgi:Arylsulfotransferase (ASST)